MFANQMITAARQLAPEIPTLLTKLESPGSIRLAEESAVLLRQSVKHQRAEPQQLSLFNDLPPAVTITQPAQAEKSGGEPLRRVFVSTASSRNLSFQRPMLGTLNVKEIMPSGELSKSNLLAFHHMDRRGLIRISDESAARLKNADCVVTCHPDILARQSPHGQKLIEKHIMPNTSGPLKVRHSNIRVLDKETGRYGYLFDIVNEPFLKQRPFSGVRSPKQMSLSFEEFNPTAPLGLQKRANPWLFIDNPALVLSG